MLGAIVYLLFFSVILGIAALVMLKTLRQNQFPPDSDDDGGIGGGGDFPIIDLPPGGKIEDILVDRWHGDAVGSSKVVQL
ncbi:MAG: hypothetical protein SFU27_00305 [Thermonemataceae bacterium]|nr:hypothetical protein [Thermonemataceae bacterium]